MNREEIEKKAKEIYDNPLAHANRSCEMLLIQHCNDFITGAEWMQEQCHKDLLEANAEIEKQHVQDIKDLQGQKQAEISELTNLVSARDGMIEQMAERMEELNDKVSELTEALDASHVFCKGVKNAVVKKAAKWIKDHVHCYFQVWYDKMTLAVHSDECATDFIKAMKEE